MKKQNKIILGLTGSFGSGKTTVAAILRSFGAKIIDADKLAHACLRPQSPCYKKIMQAFGTVDRKKIGGIVFNDKLMLAKLNSIIHPEVIKEIKYKIKQYKTGIIVIDAPLLFEAGLGKTVDKIIVVKASLDKQASRIQKKTKLSKKEILLRIKSQIALSEKVRLADFLIDNNGTIKETKKQLVLIRRKLWRN